MKILVIGGSGGIGKAVVSQLVARPSTEKIFATFNRHIPELRHDKLEWLPLNVTDEADYKTLSAAVGALDMVINCVGLLHTPRKGPEKTVLQFESDFFLESMRINTMPTLLLAKHMATALRGSEQSIFATISARVGSIEENKLGGWYSYRASKAALNMALKTLAIEWHRKLPRCCVAALHPGTTDSKLSKPFQSNVPPEKLFSADRTASQLLAIIDDLTPDKTGRFWSWDGRELPW